MGLMIWARITKAGRNDPIIPNCNLREVNENARPIMLDAEVIIGNSFIFMSNNSLAQRIWYVDEPHQSIRLLQLTGKWKYSRLM